MDFGLCLANFLEGVSPEGIDASTEAAERLGLSTVWTTDHVLMPKVPPSDYDRVYEAILTLAWVGARYPTVRLATSIIVVAQRNAVLLAKELASLDSLSGGRVTAGVGVGWKEAEFANLAAADRFPVRGAYLDETIELWRHLWSGSTEPFRGRFHDVEGYSFGPLPVQQPLPIVIGGEAEPALRRAGRLADGYHSSSTAPATYAARLPTIAAAAHAARRAMPTLSARVRVEFETTTTGYALRGDPEEMATEIRAWAAIGVTHLALFFETTDPDEIVRRLERFVREVAPLV